MTAHPDYEISDEGRCRWFDTGKPVKAHRRRKYLAFTLRIRRTPIKWKRFLVHRLVLETFVGPCPPNHETRHMNGRRHDNKLQNLQWGTHAENIDDNVRLDANPRGARHWRFRLTAQDVETIRAVPTPFSKTQRAELMARFKISLATLYRIRNDYSTRIWLADLERITDQSART
jgi:hypothetical protein